MVAVPGVRSIAHRCLSPTPNLPAGPARCRRTSTREPFERRLLGCGVCDCGVEGLGLDGGWIGQVPLEFLVGVLQHRRVTELEELVHRSGQGSGTPFPGLPSARPVGEQDGARAGSHHARPGGRHQQLVGARHPMQDRRSVRVLHVHEDAVTDRVVGVRPLKDPRRDRAAGC